jgi:hypothetical protein
MDSRFQDHSSGLMTVRIPNCTSAELALRMIDALSSDAEIRFVGCDQHEMTRFIDSGLSFCGKTMIELQGKKFEIIAYPSYVYHHNTISKIEGPLSALHFSSYIAAFIALITEWKPCIGNIMSLPFMHGDEARVAIFDYRPGSIVEQEEPVWHFYTASIRRTNVLLRQANHTILSFRMMS